MPQFREGGCYPAENGFAWTDGNFELPPRFCRCLDGAFTVAVHTRQHGLRYPLDPRPAAA